MTLGFILNGEDVLADTGATVRLVDILRDGFNLLGTKSGCCIGNCGACSVIFNGNLVKSCLVPAFKIRGGEIITIEGFSQTDDYEDIIRAFDETGLESCGFCNTGKILTAETLLSKNRRLPREEILAGFHGIRCRCTDPERLVQAVLTAFEYRNRRLYGRAI